MVADVAAAVDDTVLLTVTHVLLLVRTYMLLSVVLKYKAPTAAVPGAVACWPKYLPINVVRLVAALVADVAAAAA